MNRIKKMLGDFTQIPNAIWTSDLPDKTVRILGWMWSKPSNWTFNKKYMQKALGVSARTLDRNLKIAQSKGWLIVTRNQLENGASTYNGYWLVTPEMPSKIAPVISDTLPPSFLTPSPPSQMTPLSNTDIYSNTKENNTKVLEKKSEIWTPPVTEDEIDAFKFVMYDFVIAEIKKYKRTDVQAKFWAKEDCTKMLEFYQKKKWKVGKGSKATVMVDWKKAFGGWIRRNAQNNVYMRHHVDSPEYKAMQQGQTRHQLKESVPLVYERPK